MFISIILNFIEKKLLKINGLRREYVFIFKDILWTRGCKCLLKIRKDNGKVRKKNKYSINFKNKK